MNLRNNRIFGYGFDFWVYVVGQKPDDRIEEKVYYDFSTLKYRSAEYNGPHSFAFPVCDSAGVWYNVLSSYEEEAGTIFIKELPYKEEHFFTVPWRNQEEINDVRNITVDSAYREDIMNFLRDCINKSPIQKIYLQIRCQGLERNNIIGMLSVDQIGQLMEEDKLLGNMVYVLYDPRDTQ